MKEGDKFVRDWNWRRHEADMKMRLELFKALMQNADKDDICPVCGCDLQMYADQLHDSHNHYNGDGQLIFSYPDRRE